MGRNSRARRTARATRAARAAAQAPGAPGAWDEHGWPMGTDLREECTPPPTRGPVDGAELGQQVRYLFAEADEALDRGWGDVLDDAAVALAARCADPDGRRVVVVALLESITGAVDTAWARGWQPADVHRVAVRRLQVAEQPLVVDAISHQLDQYAPASIDPRWHAQLRELESRVWWPRSGTWIEANRERGLDWVTLILGCLAVRHLLARLPVLEVLTPLPGTVAPPEPTAAEAAPRPSVDERVLSRVRMLLAKAESTTFEAEAETFTAGAQSLMARHSIDAALLAADDEVRLGGHGAPSGRRIGIDNPYEGPKAMLLDAVASANRCRMVWSKELGFGTVVGFESDLESVELLFTSLLVQATRTMTSAGARSDHQGRSRTRSFRHAFLTAYAGRIGERLLEATVGEEQEAVAVAHALGRELAPVLAARAEEVDDALAGWFPTVRTRRVGSVRDAEGWHSGRAAADRAQLGTGSAIGS